MVRWAFHTILGHYVVSQAAIEYHQKHFPRFALLCEGLKNSNEFASNYAGRSVQLAAVLPDAAMRTIVTSLYRHHLHHDPDTAALNDACALLKQMGGLEAVAQFSAVFAKVLGHSRPGASDNALRAVLPEQPAAPWRFVGREREMAGLLDWFMRGERRRLFLEGPDGAGRTTLAVEFGRRLAAAGRSVILPGGARLDHVIFVTGNGPDATARPTRRILEVNGWVGDQNHTHDEASITKFLASSSGLIILDGQDAAEDELLVQMLAANRHHRVLYTHAPGHNSAQDHSIQVAGFGEDAEYDAFLAVCAACFGTEVPAPAEHEAIARWSHGLPRRIERLFEVRRRAASFAQAITLAGHGPF